MHSAPRMNDFACYRNVPCHQVCFYDAGLFAERGYDTDFRVRADYEHFLYCIYDRKAEAVYMPVTVAFYEGGGFSETRENRKRSALEPQGDHTFLSGLLEKKFLFLPHAGYFGAAAHENRGKPFVIKGL